MFRFAHIDLLWLLTLIPVFVAAFVIYTRRKRRQLADFGDPELVQALMPDASRKRPAVKFALLMVALALLIIAAARPQYGQKSETIHRQGIEAMIALDISNSMLAEDVAPCRLDRAKQVLSKLIDNMVDDKVGLVIFAGESYVQLPITCDYVSAKMFLNSITPELIQTQGTAIGSAIQTCIRSFGEPNEAGRCIILITDGENHEDDAEAAAEQALQVGIQTFVVGIGKTEGSPIPVPGTSDYRKDREGNVVVSRLNEDMCQSIAKAGRGMYVHCDNTNTATRALQKEMDKLASAEIDTEVFSDYNEQYQSFALLALLILAVEFFIFARQNHLVARWKLFIVLLACSAMPAFAQQEAPHVRHGNHDYKAGNFTEAEIDYRRGIEKNDKSFEAHYNLGNALFRQDKYPEAAEQYAKAGELVQKGAQRVSEVPEADRLRLSQAYHNLGNALYGQQNYGEAVKAFENSLRLNPKDNDTRYNLVKAMKQMQQQQNQQNQNKNQDQQKQEQQNQDQNQDQNEQQQQQQQPENQMDKETAEQILQALEQDEQDTQDKMQRVQGQKRRVEKDW